MQQPGDTFQIGRSGDGSLLVRPLIARTTVAASRPSSGSRDIVYSCLS